MTWIPTFKIYASDGTTLVYNLAQVIDIQGWPKDNPFSVQLVNTRSGSAITIPGGDKPYDIIITGRLAAANYTDLTTAMFSLRNTIVKNTHYYLKIDTSISTTDNLKVMRLNEIVWDDKGLRRTKVCYYTITFSVNSW